MTKREHSPGPWNNYMGDDIYCVYDCNGRKICNIEAVDIVGWNARFRDESEANEALISAAPQLLAALQMIVQLNPELPMGCIEDAEAAIAKATGNQQ